MERQKTSRWFLIVALVALFLATLASCTTTNEQSLAEHAIASPSESELNTDHVATPQSGGVFRRIWGEPPTLDPHQVADAFSLGIVIEIFSGLVALSTDLTLVPDLAESWSLSTDATTYTFQLRNNAKFHNGRPVTASDVKYSLERALDPALYSPTVDTYLDDIVGAKDRLNGLTSQVSGVKVIDLHTVEITVKEPRAYFLAKLTYPTAFIIDKEDLATRPNDWTRNPNGTGPFQLINYSVGERIVLQKNPLYHLGAPWLDRVEFILSGGSSMAMYENGEIDLTGVSLADIERVSNPQDPLNQELRAAPPGFDLLYIGLNIKEPPFDDRPFRRALAAAIDKPLISERILFNVMKPANRILPPGFPGYGEKVNGLHYDPNLAKQLLAESKYSENIPRIILTIPGTGGGVGLDLEVILDMWKETLGINVEIQQVEWATFLDDLHSGQLQAYAGISWQADYPDPQGFIDVLFHSKSSLNHSYYSNQEVDQLIEEARVAMEWDVRKKLYGFAEQRIIDDVPLIPLWHSGEMFMLVKPYVRGYEMTPMMVPKLRKVWMSQR